MNNQHNFFSLWQRPAIHLSLTLLCAVSLTACQTAQGLPRNTLAQGDLVTASRPVLPERLQSLLQPDEIQGASRTGQLQLSQTAIHQTLSMENVLYDLPKTAGKYRLNYQSSSEKPAYAYAFAYDGSRFQELGWQYDAKNPGSYQGEFDAPAGTQLVLIAFVSHQPTQVTANLAPPSQSQISPPLPPDFPDGFAQGQLVAQLPNLAGQTQFVQHLGQTVAVLTTDEKRQLVLYRSTDQGQRFDSQVLAGSVLNGLEFYLGKAENNQLLAFWVDKSRDGVWMRRSRDGGQSWSEPEQPGAALGATWILEPHHHYAGGQHYLTFKAYVNKQIDAWLLRFDDAGRASAPVRVTSDAAQEDGMQIAVQGQDVYLLYLDIYSSGNLLLAHSANGGQTFNAPVRVNRQDRKTDFGAVLAVNSLGQVFVAYKDTVTDSEGDLYLARSTNQGRSFEYALASEGTSRSQNYPKLAIDASNRLHLVWTDLRHNQYSLYYALSSDGQNFKSERLDASRVLRNASLSLSDTYLGISTYQEASKPQENGNILYYKRNL